MSKIKLDLKHFKHLKSDDKTTTLTHKDGGHTLTIVRSALSDDAQKQLEALAKSHMTEEQSNEAQDEKEADKKGHKALMAEGGSTRQAPQVDPEKAKGFTKGFSQPHTLSEGYENIKKGVSELFKAEGGEVEDKEAEEKKKRYPWLSEDEEDQHTIDYSKFGKEVNKKNRDIQIAERSKPRKKMADGGDVIPSTEPQQYATPNPDIQPQQAQAPQAAPEQPKMDPEKMQMYNTLITAQPVVGGNAMNDPKKYMFSPEGQQPQEFVPEVAKRVDELYAKQQLAAQQATAQAANKTVQDNAMRQQWGLAPIPVPTVGASQTGALPTVSQDQHQLADQSQPQQQPNAGLAQDAGQSQQQEFNPTQSVQNRFEEGYNEKLGSMYAAGEAQAKQAATNQDLLNKQIDAERIAQDKYKQDFTRLNGEREGVIQDIKDGYIDPNKFWTGDKNGNGGHSKVMTGIGMILAGFNPAGGPNAAIDFLKHQMNQNLEAQSRNLQAKDNLLAHNLQQFGNVRDAAQFSRIQMQDILAHQLESSAATAQTQLARDAAHNAAGQFKMDASRQFQQFAMQQAMMGLASDGPHNAPAVEKMMGYMRVMNPEMAKEMEGRYVPGYGLGTVPVPDKVRGELVAKDTMGKAAQDLLQWSKSHSTIIPGTPEYSVGQQKALALQALAREAMLNTVYREGEQPLLDKIVNSNPAGVLKSLNSLPKLQELIRYNDMTRQQVAQHYGLKAPAMQQSQQDTNQQALQWAKANPKDPRAAQILKHLGR